MDLFNQREEAVTEAKIQSFKSRATAQPPRHHMKEKRTQTLFDRFNAGDVSLNTQEQSSTIVDFSWNLVDQCNASFL